MSDKSKTRLVIGHERKSKSIYLSIYQSIYLGYR